MIETTILRMKNIVTAEHLGMQVDHPGGRLTILDDVALEVAAGDSVAIVGPSGSGKSTLLGLLAGLDRPSTGRVELLGRVLGDLDEDKRAELRRGRVGFVFQTFHLLAGMTALENVMVPFELAGFDRPRQRASALLEAVGLGARQRHFPLELSGGEQQRVALARAFAGAPEILFADEPTGNLDRVNGERVAQIMFDLRREHGTGLVLVTHDERIAGRCDRVLHMDGGRLSPA
jgi:putative ABC transport system ATP-binding protein